MTRKGVEYNLDNSHYVLEVDYHKFVFSSQFNLNRFRARYLKNREEIQTALKNRYGYQFECSEFSDICLYKQIEKRGFLIIQKRPFLKTPVRLTPSSLKFSLTALKEGE